MEVRTPRVNDKRVDQEGNRQRFNSVILPRYMRRSPKVTEVLPLLYLHGLSSGDFVPALEEFFGTEAGLSAATVYRALPSGGRMSGSISCTAIFRAGTASTSSGWTASILAFALVTMTVYAAW